MPLGDDGRASARARESPPRAGRSSRRRRRRCSAGSSTGSAARSTGSARVAASARCRPIDDRAARPAQRPRDHRARWRSACAPSTRCCPCGRGQRLGIFAGSGVGKTTLLGMIARGTRGRRQRHRADRRARARGARVHRARPRPRGPGRARWSSSRLRRARARCASAAPGRARRSPSTSAIAGRTVLLMMDSVTRFAHGAARDRPGGRRAAGAARLPADRLRRAAAPARARRHRARRRRRSPRSTPCWSRATT